MSRRRSKASERSTPRLAAIRRSRGSSLRSTRTGGARLATSSCTGNGTNRFSTRAFLHWALNDEVSGSLGKIREYGVAFSKEPLQPHCILHDFGNKSASQRLHLCYNRKAS
eukprot:947234-Prorocentrum_minimum.AAC.2